MGFQTIVGKDVMGPGFLIFFQRMGKIAIGGSADLRSRQMLLALERRSREEEEEDALIVLLLTMGVNPL